MTPYRLLPSLLLALALSACGEKLDPGTPAVFGDGTVGDTGTSGTASTGSGTAAATGTGGTAATGSTTGSTTTTGTTTGGTSTTSAGLCNTKSATIGYAANAGPVVQATCSGGSCHNPGSLGGITMTDYASTKTAFEGAGLNDVKSGNMPRGPALTADQKCILTTWASGGYAQ